MGIIFAIIIMIMIMMITIIIKVKSLLLVYTSFTCLGVTVLGMAGVMAYIFRMQVSMNMIIMMMITFFDEVMDKSIIMTITIEENKELWIDLSWCKIWNKLKLDGAIYIFVKNC